MSLRQLREWRALGMPRFLLRLAAIGAFAGLASWLLVYALHPWFDEGPPTLLALALAIPRGALLGVIFGLLLARFLRSDRRGAGPGASPRQ